MKLLSNSLLAVVLTAPFAFAQSATAVLATADASGVYANRQRDAARAGTPADPDLGLRTSDGRLAGAGSLAVLHSVRTPNGPGVGGRFHVTGFAQDGNVAGTLGGNPFGPGPQSYELVLRSRQPVTGDVFVLFDGNVRNAATAAAGVGIGTDARRFQADGQPQRGGFRGVQVDATGLTIRVNLIGEARGVRGVGGGFDATLEVLFVASGGGGGCTVSFGQPSCTEGGGLRGQATTGPRGGQLALSLNGAYADAIGVTFVSPFGRTTPFANTNCVLFAQPIVHELFRTDATGHAATSIAFPLRSGEFFVQQATLRIAPGGIALGTSNTLQVTCN